MANDERWQFFIDRGGTFTDCIGRHPQSGAVSFVKVPSSDEAPLVGIRRLLGLLPGAPIPPCEVRLGTTLGTNALLERRGARSALVLTRGFGDLLELGDQTRPDLFALRIEVPTPLPERVLEVDARLGADGKVLSRPDFHALSRELVALRHAGIDSLGIAILNDYRHGELEAEIAAVARGVGFSHVSTSHEVSANIGYLARASSVALDAYLTPLLKAYLANLRASLPGSRLLLMQSSGGLCEAERFRGAASVLSGPAGGAEGLARVAHEAGISSHAVGFDMGGTSTDVSLVAPGAALARKDESRVGGTRIVAPMVDVHTVAAGGGSICRFDGERLRVGPESVGAQPGPLCYGNPEARELSLTDVNLVLGRLIADRFPLPLSLETARAHLADLADALTKSGHPYTPLEVAEGFFRIANANMAQAIREVTVTRGFDLREQALVAFGGAAGQHACSLARELGVREILFHPAAGVLSAWGIGMSRLNWDARQDAGGVGLTEPGLTQLGAPVEALIEQGRAALTRDGASPERVRTTARLGLRYAGTETVLAVPFPTTVEQATLAFEEQFQQLFGYRHAGRALEIADVRVDVTEAADEVPSVRKAMPADADPAPPLRHTRWFFHGTWVEQVPVFAREALRPGTKLVGPAIIAEQTGTIALEPGFELRVDGDGCLRVALAEAPRAAAAESTPHRAASPLTTTGVPRGAAAPAIATSAGSRTDPVLLEIYANRFMSIAEQMGRTLRRTAMSVNIRERLDFSCAVFDAAGELIANAPHIPVHLGAMSESVKAVLAAHPQLLPGDVFVTNDPACGGSHLPDITVILPVHDTGGALRFFSAARGHHADVGGSTPGSMPAFSSSLAEEGIVLSVERVGSAGQLRHDRLQELFTRGPWPARRVAENLADLDAQLAAVRTGRDRLLALAEERGFDEVEAYMRAVQDNAGREVQRALARLAPGRHSFQDALDDGTPVAVTLEVTSERLRVDFTGTGAQHAGNLNAPRAVTLACVLYFLRVLVGKPIPLNSGCLRHVEVVIPERSLLAPDPDRAVAGGNVETSQRVVDVLLGAAGLLAGSQGTMNNLSFGDDSYGYYETIAGGAGAGQSFSGASAVHTHMTNTRITDAEVMERRFPVRVLEHSIRRGSGGAGRFPGGDGVRRSFEFLRATHVSVLSQRRARGAFGLAGGSPGAPGENIIDGSPLPGATAFEVAPGARLTLLTPGGGGYGAPATTLPGASPGR